MTQGTAAADSPPRWQVLVADDDEDARFLMSNAFRRAGFEVHEASNGNELVASFTAHATARTVVVSDIGMPECDGIAATIALRKLQPAVLVLLVTAFANPTTLSDAHNAGAAKVLNKPLNFDGLVQTALALLTRA
jgi:CheY-like chemotaxis protein